MPAAFLLLDLTSLDTLLDTFKPSRESAENAQAKDTREVRIKSLGTSKLRGVDSHTKVNSGGVFRLVVEVDLLCVVNGFLVRLSALCCRTHLGSLLCDPHLRAHLLHLQRVPLHPTVVSLGVELFGEI